MGLKPIVYPKNGGPAGTRTLINDLQNRCNSLYTTSPLFGGAYWDRTSRAIKTADLQSTASPLMLLLHNLYTLLGMCVLKHTGYIEITHRKDIQLCPLTRLSLSLSVL